MSKKKNIFQYVGEALNDKFLKENGENIKFDDKLISDDFPKRDKKAFKISTKNRLNEILSRDKSENSETENQTEK